MPSGSEVQQPETWNRKEKKTLLLLVASRRSNDNKLGTCSKVGGAAGGAAAGAGGGRAVARKLMRARVTMLVTFDEAGDDNEKNVQGVRPWLFVKSSSLGFQSYDTNLTSLSIGLPLQNRCRLLYRQLGSSIVPLK